VATAATAAYLSNGNTNKNANNNLGNNPFGAISTNVLATSVAYVFLEAVKLLVRITMK
jgi:hypothetical protein